MRSPRLAGGTIASVANQQLDALRKQQRGVERQPRTFGWRIIGAMQLCRVRGKAAECVSTHWCDRGRASDSCHAEALASAAAADVVDCVSTVYADATRWRSLPRRRHWFFSTDAGHAAGFS
jgi:hypothetical protein